MIISVLFLGVFFPFCRSPPFPSINHKHHHNHYHYHHHHHHRISCFHHLFDLLLLLPLLLPLLSSATHFCWWILAVVRFALSQITLFAVHYLALSPPLFSILSSLSIYFSSPPPSLPPPSWQTSSVLRYSAPISRSPPGMSSICPSVQAFLFFCFACCYVRAVSACCMRISISANLLVPAATSRYADLQPVGMGAFGLVW